MKCADCTQISLLENHIHIEQETFCKDRYLIVISHVEIGMMITFIIMKCFYEEGRGKDYDEVGNGGFAEEKGGERGRSGEGREIEEG